MRWICACRRQAPDTETDAGRRHPGKSSYLEKDGCTWYAGPRWNFPEPGNKGHYHEEGGEFWLIMLGHIRYNIEGLREFEAEEGDVVYAPRQTWHCIATSMPGSTNGK